MAGPIEKHRKLPGNMGNGASKDATVNIRKKIIRIDAPFIAKPTVERSCAFLFTG